MHSQSTTAVDDDAVAHGHSLRIRVARPRRPSRAETPTPLLRSRREHGERFRRARGDAPPRPSRLARLGRAISRRAARVPPRRGDQGRAIRSREISIFLRRLRVDVRARVRDGRHREDGLRRGDQGRRVPVEPSMRAAGHRAHSGGGRPGVLAVRLHAPARGSVRRHRAPDGRADEARPGVGLALPARDPGAEVPLVGGQARGARARATHRRRRGCPDVDRAEGRAGREVRRIQRGRSRRDRRRGGKGERGGGERRRRERDRDPGRDADGTPRARGRRAHRPVRPHRGDLVPRRGEGCGGARRERSVRVPRDDVLPVAKRRRRLARGTAAAADRPGRRGGGAEQDGGREGEGGRERHRRVGGHRRGRGPAGGIRAAASVVRGEGGRRGDADDAEGVADGVFERVGRRLSEMGERRGVQSREGGGREGSRRRGGEGARRLRESEQRGVV
ncbi:uncharacterized protein MICPUCDRAFT_69976 [Micromonas pusilla CCMP1545]|uniref:Predicted protein n=1 Tax=Micromonas pusilla (strain CCMP1545) TaxID=564608 RepID=C1N1Q8_MICPC|nr:uncharacterized protein MICPUCDRAFT_69976 [Micromonas pusilla CCMP1545]EEH53872.1 predicted protein [Micromonas pusilla CCMP1545]|eukprot:XP_003062160.1 predicted protein [Micromonas pusilla CCMP1545]